MSLNCKVSLFSENTDKLYLNIFNCMEEQTGVNILKAGSAIGIAIDWATSM